MQALTFFFAFVAVLALIGAAAWLVRRFAGNRLGANTNRGRMPRLAVIDAAAVDGRRRLVLVRRDNIEHLLMIGGPTDIVVEPNIVRASRARPDVAAAGRRRHRTAAANGAAARSGGWSDGDGPRADAFDHPEPQMPEPPRPARPSFADEVRRPAPALPERRSDPLPASRRSRSAAGPEPRPELRNEPLPPAGDMPRSEPMMPRPSRPSEAPKAPPVRAPNAVAPPPPPPPPAPRRSASARPKSRRDGAAAGGGVAPAGRRSGEPRVGAPPVAPEPPPSPQPAPRRTDGTAGCRPAAEDRLRESGRRDGIIAGPSEDPFVRSASFPRRVLFFATLIAAGSLADPAFAQDISINLGQGNGGVTERAIQLIALLTVLSIAPSILIMMTSFTRIVVVLSLLRTALGTATAPPNSVMIALAMFLTAFVMGPVLQKSYDDGIKPLVANQISVEEALQRASVPLRGFMEKNVREKDLKLFIDLSGEPPPATPEDMSLRILMPAFMISELKRAFEIGFLLFLPFLIIDLVVASVLMSMGMMMLPPVVVSLPFKLIFFVLVDGWSLVAGSLVQSYGG